MPVSQLTPANCFPGPSRWAHSSVALPLHFGKTVRGLLPYLPNEGIGLDNPQDSSLSTSEMRGISDSVSVLHTEWLLSPPGPSPGPAGSWGLPLSVTGHEERQEG